MTEETLVKRPTSSWLYQRVRLFERRALVRLLRRCRGVARNAARRAGYNRNAFYKLMESHGVSAKDFKSS